MLNDILRRNYRGVGATQPKTKNIDKPKIGYKFNSLNLLTNQFIHFNSLYIVELIRFYHNGLHLESK